MAYPNSIDTIPTYAGTSLMGDVDHAGVLHGTANTIILALENTLGTTGGTSVLKDFTAGDFCVKSSAGASGHEINTGTATNVFATPKGIADSDLSYIGGTETLSNKTLVTPIVKTAYNMGTIGTTETVNWANGDLQTGTLDENVTITFGGAVAGQRLTLFLLQDGTGTNTITWADTITWQDNITWGTTYY